VSLWKKIIFAIDKNKINMKKIFALTMVCMLSIAALAQNFKIKSFDVKGNFRSDFGIGAGVTMGVDVFDFSPSYNYYFNSNSNYWTLDADFHYNFVAARDVAIYPIAGLALLSDGDVTKIGADIGAGINYDLNSEWSLKAELKYQVIKNWDELYLSVGASYHF